MVEGTLTAGDLERLRKDFSANPVYRLAQNAVTRVTVDDVAINREIVSRIDHSVSTTLDDWKVTNQEQSGRCWLFAGLNLLRVGAMRKGGLKEFEFSQNYVMFWDKLERANYFLEAGARYISGMSCGLVAVDTSVHETNAARIDSPVLSAQVVVPKVLGPGVRSAV